MSASGQIGKAEGEPPEGIGEPELPQIEFQNPADQSSRKSNRRHKKPERFKHNIYD